MWSPVLVAFIALGANAHMDEKKNAPTKFYGAAGITLKACAGLIANQTTYCKDDETYACGCMSSAFLSTLGGCLDYFDQFNDKALAKLDSECEEMNTTVSKAQFVLALDTYKSSAVSISDISNFNASEALDVPIKLNTTLLQIYHRSYYNYYGNYDRSILWGAGLLAYWAFVFFIATICHWTKKLDPVIVKLFTGPVSAFWRRHITLPALARKSRSAPVKLWGFLDFLAPSRLELVILFVFLLLTAILCGAGFGFSQPDPKFPSFLWAVCRLVADRTGIMATSLVPLLILFAGRNNFLQWLTGWPFSRFICFHRWISRLMLILVFIHAVGLTVRFVLRDIYKDEVREDYFIFGIVALLAGCIITVQGLMTLRRNWYEIFLLAHIALAALFLAGAWRHLTTMGYVWYMYIASTIWLFDRFVRIVRLFVFGFPKAQVSLVGDMTLRVVIPRPLFWRDSPGSHAFIHFIRPSCFWQSHPFTFVSKEVDDRNIVMFLKVKGGITHGLYQYLQKQPQNTATIRVAVEGPYGGKSPADRYDTSVFVAGGNGIPGIYSEALNAARRRDVFSPRAVKLYWIIRDHNELLWFKQELLALKEFNVDTTICVTRKLEETKQCSTPDILEGSSADSNSDRDEKLQEQQQLVNLATIDIRSNIDALLHIKFTEGRPNLNQLVCQEIEEAPGSIAFVACGHPSMVDDLRNAVVDNFDTTKKRVDFFEQLQVWS